MVRLVVSGLATVGVVAVLSYRATLTPTTNGVVPSLDGETSEGQLKIYSKLPTSFGFKEKQIATKKHWT